MKIVRSGLRIMILRRLSPKEINCIKISKEMMERDSFYFSLYRPIEEHIASLFKCNISKGYLYSLINPFRKLDKLVLSNCNAKILFNSKNASFMNKNHFQSYQSHSTKSFPLYVQYTITNRLQDDFLDL